MENEWEMNNNGQYDVDAFLGVEDHATSNEQTEANEGRQLEKGKSSKRFTVEKINELESFFERDDHPNDEMRHEIATKLGMEPRQVMFWFHNRRSLIKVKKVETENIELWQENAKMLTENNEIQQQLLGKCCSRCHDPTAEKWLLLDENARLKGMYQGAIDQMIKLNHKAGLPNSSNTLEHLASAPVNLVPAFSCNGSTDQDIILSYAKGALKELEMLASIGQPMWLPTAGGDTLNRQEYYHHRFLCQQGFVIEGTRAVDLVRGTALELVGILTDEPCWSKLFPDIVAQVRASQVISYGNFVSPLDGHIQEMDVDLWVQSPRSPIRRVKFLRFSKKTGNKQWAVVDVSIEGIHGVEWESENMYTSCRLLPSGCLIQDMNNGYCKVTWIVRAQYIENSVPPLFRQLFQSGEALGARRWLASLQRECEYMALLHSSHVSGNCSSGAAMSPMGRRGVLLLAQQMMASFYMAVSGPVIQGPSNIIVNEWRGHTGTTVRMFEAPVRMVIRNCPARNTLSASGERSFPVLSATTTLWLPGTPPKHIFEYLCNGYCRGEWDTFCYPGAVHELSKVVTSPHLRGNAVSILQPIVRDGTGNSNMLLQHASTDMSCSLVVYSIVARDVMCEVMDGSNSCIPLLPSGFAILPDGHGGNKAHPAAASSSSAPADQNSNAGSLLTVAFQTLLQSSSYNNDVAVSIDDAGNQICRVIMNILAAVGADIAIPA